MESLPFLEPLGEVFRQIRTLRETLEGTLHVVLQAAEVDGLIVNDDVGGSLVTVTGLADRADVHHDPLGAARVLVAGIDLAGVEKHIGLRLAKMPG